MLSLSDIHQAAERIAAQRRRTPLFWSHYFSSRLKRTIGFKCENLQRTGSFKIRGAYNFMAQLTPAQIKAGVSTASAGNHAQGIALAAALLQSRATVVMPVDTPLAKILATEAYGAEVILAGESYDEAAELAGRLAKERNLLPVPAFDHPAIMAGQGTIGLELLQDCPDLETLLVPVGGGGLIAGIATAVKAERPEVRIIGVEAAAAASAASAREKGGPVKLTTSASLADGIAIKQVGDLTFPLIERLVDDLVSVSEEAIAQAIVALLEKGKMVVEGAGAVGLAQLLFGSSIPGTGKTVILLTGGNLDLATMSRVVQRGLLAEGRIVKLRVELADRPGELSRLTSALAKNGGNILQINHDRRKSALPLGRAEVHLELEVRGESHIESLVTHLQACHWQAVIE